MMPRDTSEIMRRVVRDPIAAADEARDKYVASEETWLQAKYEVLAVIFALGQHLMVHGSAWRRFIKSPFFAYRKHRVRPIRDQPKAMRLAAYWVLAADSDAKRDRAAAYVRGLQVLARRNVRADDVVSEIIKAGGIEALIQQAKTDPTRPQPYVAPESKEKPAYYDLGDDDDDQMAEVELDELDDTDGDDNNLEMESDKGRHGGRISRVVHDRDPAGRPTIKFEMTEARQERFLNLCKGEVATIKVIGQGVTKEGWCRIRVKKVRWNAS